MTDETELSQEELIAQEAVRSIGKSLARLGIHPTDVSEVTAQMQRELTGVIVEILQENFEENFLEGLSSKD